MPLITGPARDVRLGYQLARLIHSLDYNPNGPEANDAIYELYGAYPAISSPSNIIRNNYPVTFGCCANATGQLIWMSGLRRAGTVSAMVRSYTDRVRNSSTEAYVKQLKDYADDIFGYVNTSRPLVPGTQCVIAGHSLGGAIAYPLADRISAANPGMPVSVVNFGAPKAFGHSFGTSARNYSVLRYTTPNDIVPSLPPLRIYAPTLYGLLPSIDRYNLSHWANTEGYTSLSPAGGVTAMTGDPAIAEITLTTIGAVLNSREGMFGPSHSIDTYREYMELASIAAPAAPPPAVAIPLIAQAIPVETPAMATNERNSIIVFRESATTNDSIPTDIPFPNRVEVVKVDRIYYCYWTGLPICIGPSKKKCRALARHLNRFLRIYQGVGQSYSMDFVNALSDYLTYASDAAQEFRPILNDGGFPPIPVAPE